MKKKFGMTTGLLMIVVLLVSMAIGATGAKYVTQEQTTGQVTITADIGTIALWESRAVRQPSGAYELDAATPVATNSYDLIPGLDIPKDPYVVITKKDALPVYVYVEVVDGLGTGSGISYTLSADWEDLGVTGPNGGKIYAYKSQITTNQTIDILENNTVYVSQKLNKAAGNLELTFHAYMYQAITGKTAAQVYDQLKN